MKIQSGTFTFDAKAFPHLANPKPPGDRTAQDNVNFPVAFRGVPTVSVSLNRLDSGHGANTRVLVHTDSITNDGFELLLTTWWDGVIHSAGVSWIAYEA